MLVSIDFPFSETLEMRRSNMEKKQFKPGKACVQPSPTQAKNKGEKSAIHLMFKAKKLEELIMLKLRP